MRSILCLSNSLLLVLVVGLALCTTATSCRSKTERKADKIIDERQDVAKAKEKGVADVTLQKKEAELNKARADYQKAWNAERISLRRQIEAKLKEIDTKINRLEHDQQTPNGKTLRPALNELRQKRSRLSQLLEELDNPTEATWDKLKADLRRIS